MRKITKDIIGAFLRRETRTIGNSHTDGRRLLLHGNEIAKFDKTGRLWITTAGWKSNTTKERLNGLPGVSIHQRDYTWYLNGEPWNGDWVYIPRY